jgi:hypothetical protein
MIGILSKNRKLVYSQNVLCARTIEKFVDWRQLAAVMHREAVIVMPSYSGGGNVVVA